MIAPYAQTAEEQPVHFTVYSLAALSVRGDWTVVGWLITLGYLVLSVLCYRAAARDWRVESARSTGKRPIFWALLCIAMFALCVNKQLDLQTDLTQFGRHLAHRGGWYQERRRVQMVVISSICVIAAASLIGSAWFYRQQWRRYGLAYVGIVYLIAYVLIRACSFHHVDQMLFHSPYGKSSISSLLEFVGQLTIGVAATRAGRARASADPP